MSGFVLDASMALAWHFPDEVSERSETIAAMTDTCPVTVPAHWFAEIANGMLMGERRRRTSAEEAVRFADRLALLDIEVDDIEPPAMFDRILPLARAHGLTIYDTFYLELAGRRGLPLASLDERLNAAARNVGIALLAQPS